MAALQSQTIGKSVLSLCNSSASRRPPISAMRAFVGRSLTASFARVRPFLMTTAEHPALNWLAPISSN